MPLNPEAVGTTSDPFETTWTSKDALLYAVGIGAGVDELAFTTENTSGVDQQVFPTFPVVLGWGAGSVMRSIGSFNPAMLVHGQQAVTLHRPLPVEGTATLVSTLDQHVRQGQGSGGGHRNSRRDERIPALHHHLFSVHPWRRRLGWRSWPVRPGQCATGPQPRSSGHLSDLTGSGAGLPTFGRSQSVAL
jgi:hypothetical protein